MKKLNILVLHNMGPMHNWFTGVADVELMFPRNDKNNNYLVHNCFINIPNFIKEFSFDAIIMMSTFMDKVVGGGLNSNFVKQLNFIKQTSSVKIVFPQDDYWFSEVRDQFYVEYEIDRVYPVCPESSWSELLPRFEGKGGDMRQGYTTYISSEMISKVKKKKEWAYRKNDVVYRAKKTPAAPNKYGFIKGVIGDRFVDAVKDGDLKLDISTSPNKLIHGEGWLDFISDSRAILGSNSGSSVRLRNHDVYNALLNYQKIYTSASWEEVEISVFDKDDREKEYTAISPRNIEAAMMGVVQILTPGLYGGFLKPYRDFFPLEEDCSNAEQIICFLKDEPSCLRMVENCFNSLMNEVRLHVDNVIDEVLEYIEITSSKESETKIDFELLNEKYIRWEKYESILPTLLLYSRKKIMSILPNEAKDKLRNILLRGDYK